MTRLARFGLFLVLAALVAGAGGCGQPLKPMQFNNRMGTTNKKLADAAKKFSKAIEPLKFNRPTDPSALSTAYGEVGSAVKEAHRNFEDVLPPHNSKAGADLFEKYRTFLAQQQTIYDKCITPMYNIAQNNAVSPAERYREIAPLLTKATIEEGRGMDGLRKSHQEFVKYHNFEAR